MVIFIFSNINNRVKFKRSGSQDRKGHRLIKIQYNMKLSYYKIDIIIARNKSVRPRELKDRRVKFNKKGGKYRCKRIIV